ERPVVGLGDVRVGGQARDQDIRLALGIEQMPDMSGMHEIEHTVAHDDVTAARARAYRIAQLVDRLDLMPEGLGQLCHATGPEPRWANHTRVASAIDAASHSGASRQLSI